MRSMRWLWLAAACATGVATPDLVGQDLSGLWGATLRFGPEVRGPLLILRDANGFRADIAGFAVRAGVRGDTIAFELPDGKGSFRGRLTGREIVGHWVQPVTSLSGGRYATPVTLTSDGDGRWRGRVAPLEDRFTFYMPVTRTAAGTYATHLRNPERNQGRFIAVSRIAVDSPVVRLFGRRGRDTAAVWAEGMYQDDVLRIGMRGSTFDFTRIRDETSPFYPRRKSGERYSYAPPVQRDDGWRVASLESEGISREQIERFVQMLIDTPMDSLGSPQIHGVLIARRGRLVLEEYFHGYHRDLPHDTRSAAKSWTATLIGAAMHAGVQLSLDTPVYQTMLGTLPADLDPRKRAMTLRHLVSMTAGFYCNDNDEAAPGREDAMQEQTAEPDWYRYTMNVPMVTTPGDSIVYCSAEANLAGGVLAKVAREPLPELFHRLVARPLQMGPYHLFLTPTGEAYGGGGHHFLPRDFLKLAQVMADDGKWRGTQVISSDWARASGAALRNLGRSQQYGYLWNSVEYPRADRTVRAIFAGGNGGQLFMAIPELDLVIGFTGGAYAHPSSFTSGAVYVPGYILPAVR